MDPRWESLSVLPAPAFWHYIAFCCWLLHSCEPGSLFTAGSWVEVLSQWDIALNCVNANLRGVDQDTQAGSVISASVSVSDHCSIAVLLNCLCVQREDLLKMPWKLDDLPSGSVLRIQGLYSLMRSAAVQLIAFGLHSMCVVVLLQATQVGILIATASITLLSITVLEM